MTRRGRYVSYSGSVGPNSATGLAEIGVVGRQTATTTDLTQPLTRSASLGSTRGSQRPQPRPDPTVGGRGYGVQRAMTQPCVVGTNTTLPSPVRMGAGTVESRSWCPAASSAGVRL